MILVYLPPNHPVGESFGIPQAVESTQLEDEGPWRQWRADKNIFWGLYSR